MSLSLQKLKDVKGIRGILFRSDEARRRAGFALRGAYNFARLRLESKGTRPCVTAVVVGRNDDYMSDFRERLHATIEWNMRHLIDEVIFVEWNPPADRTLLAHDLTKRFPSLRAYVVPSEVHDRVCENTSVKLLEYHAKNVGIRRARTPWIMTTNADAALGLDMVDKILTTPLEPEIAWTAQRADVPWREDEQRRIDLLTSMRYRRLSPYNQLGTGEFTFASRELWHRARGYDETMVRHRIGCDMRGTAQMLALGARIERAGIVLHLQHPTSCSENVQPHHGEWANIEGLPYENRDDWGLGAARETPLAERIWRLEID